MGSGEDSEVLLGEVEQGLKGTVVTERRVHGDRQRSGGILQLN